MRAPGTGYLKARVLKGGENGEKRGGKDYRRQVFLLPHCSLLFIIFYYISPPTVSGSLLPHFDLLYSY